MKRSRKRSARNTIEEIIWGPVARCVRARVDLELHRAASWIPNDWSLWDVYVSGALVCRLPMPDWVADMLLACREDGRVDLVLDVREEETGLVCDLTGEFRVPAEQLELMGEVPPPAEPRRLRYGLGRVTRDYRHYRFPGLGAREVEDLIQEIVYGALPRDPVERVMEEARRQALRNEA